MRKHPEKMRTANVVVHARCSSPNAERSSIMAEKHSSRLIPLTQGQFAIVDAEDYERISQWTWFARYNRSTKRFYANRNAPVINGKRRSIQMANVILDVTGIVDHRNHNSLDNRKQNLRSCTLSQNCMNKRTYSNNKSGHAGVYWEKRRNKWKPFIRKDGKLLTLGSFVDVAEAIRARRQAEQELFGEFANEPT